MQSGVYKIQSKIKPNKIYIGSTQNINGRWYNHLFELNNNNNHINKKLQNHVNKYGGDDLQFTVLMNCIKENLVEYEQLFIDIYNPWFNISPTAYSCLGMKRSEETKRKIGEKSRNLSVEIRERIRQKLIGRKIPKEVIEKRSQKIKGRKYSEEHRGKISIALMNNKNALGCVQSPETREKHRLYSLGNKSWTGKKLSEDHKRYISEGHKKRKNILN